MLSKILKVNQFFVPSLLYIFSLGLVFLLFSSSNMLNGGWISFFLLGATLGMYVVYSNYVSFFKGTHYFEFFCLVAIILLIYRPVELRFFSGFLFLSVVLLQLLDERDMGEKLLSPFDIGFFTGISILLYPPFWVFSLFLLTHYIALSRIQLQGLLLSLLGILTMGLLVTEISVLFNISSIPYHFLENIRLVFPSFLSTYSFWLLPIAVALISALIDYFKNINKHVVEKKVVFFNAICLLFFSFLFFFLYGGKSGNEGILIALPIAVLLTNYVLYCRPLYKELILWSFVVALVLFKYAHLIILPGVLKDISF